ncbi:glycosyltransferase family 39 protein [bacterium]|nr:glycosyltransferase family 39 protein [bacterium]
MKKDSLFNLFLIVVFGFLLRIWFLDKPEGLWNDEYVSWHIASQKDLWIFFQDMVRNCHTPLYYLYLKIWMFLFSDTDTALRYSSVVPSILSIVIMFLAGKELKDRKLGYLCAFLTAISSFLIYFAQEVRLYSLVFLLSTLCNLFAIKLLKKVTKKDMICLFISSMLLVLTHTLGIIYAFLLLVILFYFIICELDEKKRKRVIYNLSIYVLLPITAIVIIVLPFLYNILTYKSLSQFWAGFSFAKIALTFTDYFSPIQINIINTIDYFSSYVLKQDSINCTFTIFAIIPFIIAIFGIICALKKHNKTIVCIFTSAIVFFFYLILIAYTGRMVLLTKYSTEMYPALIITLCYGLCSIKNKKLKNALITTYITLNLLFIFTAPTAVQRLSRPEGHYAIVALLKNSNLKNDDYVILTYYDKTKLDKYLTENDKYKFFSINKFNFNEYLYKDYDYRNVIQNGKYLYKDKFKEYPNKNITNFVDETFIKNMKKGDRIGIVTLDSVSFLSNEDMKIAINDEEKYKKAQYIFLVFSTLKNNLYYAFKDKFIIDTITQAGSWTLVVYKKTKD